MSQGVQIHTAHPGSTHVATVEQAFQLFRTTRASVGVVVFGAATAPDRLVADAVVAELQRTSGLRQLYLVHPSLVLGFITSSICLRIPTVVVKAVTTLDQARSLANAASGAP